MSNLTSRVKQTIQKISGLYAKKKLFKGDWELRLNEPHQDLPNNKISTSIYTPINFIPKSLALQFSRLINVFFLIIGLLQIVPQITTSNGIPVIYLPLGVIIVFASIKEIMEDYKRHKSDSSENNKKTLIFKDGKFVEEIWRNIRVGHIIKIQENEPIPADVLLLSTSGKNGSCYIESKNLDGETNLKAKFAHKDIYSVLNTEEKIADANYAMKYEHPNEYLYKFNGCVATTEKIIPMNDQNFILRGCFLRNTDYIIGVVCYTGHLTKIMINSTNSKAKLSKMERVLGRQILLIFLVLIVFCIISATYSEIWEKMHLKNLQYLHLSSSDPDYFSNFLIQMGSWLLLLSKYVPISLVINIEFCRLAQSALISMDPGMTQVELKIPASVQSPSLTEELGQIEYILSDKTGTLTKNIMDFKKLCIGGELYGRKPSSIDLEKYTKTPNVDFWDPNLLRQLGDPHLSSHPQVRECILLLAVCHTAVVQEHNGEKHYNTTSPDELALVNFAKSVGVEFEGLDEHHNLCVNFKGKPLQYKLLEVFEFNSDRKRMSVIVKTPEGKIMLYTKGADSAILERLDMNDKSNNDQLPQTNTHVHHFATEGYRTLMLAKRELNSELYQEWAKRYEVEKVKIVGREEGMEELQSEIEVELKLVGVTAIEDKLQDEVGPTIAKFKEAGIKVWMLTGDKVETAINIGFACHLLDESMIQLMLVEKTHKEVADSIEEKLAQIQNDTTKSMKFSLIISGDALVHAISQELSPKLMLIAKRCQALIACRVSPKQKQQFVGLIKKDNKKASILAIGDGANDVYMITTASVGIGIKGLEGQQAARASDFAIGEFKLLKRLLFYHGRENYRRNAMLINFNFYKHMVLVTSYFWYGFFSGFSGTAFIEQFMFQLFNTLFASVPIIIFAMFDSEYPATTLVNTPSLYVQGIQDKLFGIRKYLGWLFIGIWESAIISFYAILVFDQNFWDSKTGYFIGLLGPGMFVFTAVILVVNLKIFAISHTYNFLVFFFVIGCSLTYVLCFIIFSFIKSSDTYGLLNPFFGNPNLYIGLAVVILATYMPSLGYKSIKQLENAPKPEVIYRQEAKQIKNVDSNVDLNGTDLTKEEQTGIQSSNILIMKRLSPTPTISEVTSMPEENL